MQIWQLLYGVSVDDLKKRYSIEEIKASFVMQRENAIGEFLTSSVMNSPTNTPAELAIWAEWEDKDELWGHCMKGLLLGIHDGLEEEFIFPEDLSATMAARFDANVKPIGKIRWIKEEHKDPIEGVSELLDNALKQR